MGAELEDGVTSAAVASHLDRPVRETSLTRTASEGLVSECVPGEDAPWYRRRPGSPKGV